MTPTSAETKMTASRPIRHYALGNTDAEHERLIRQAARLAPLTEHYSVKRASAQVNVSSILVLASGTLPCWQPV
jgi:hypothetical protein